MAKNISVYLKKGFVIYFKERFCYFCNVYISHSVFHFMGECKEGKSLRGEVIQRDGRRNMVRD